MEKIRGCSEECQYRNSANLCYYGKVCRSFCVPIDWDDWKSETVDADIVEDDLERFDGKTCLEINTRATIVFSALVDLLKAILPSERISDAVEESENAKWTRIYIDTLAHLSSLICSCDRITDERRSGFIKNSENYVKLKR